METTYENIKSLIASEIWEGNMVKLKFKASNQPEGLETMGVAMPDQEEMMKKMMAEATKTGASNMAINSAGSLLGSLTGISELGTAASGLANQAGLGYQMDTNKMMSVELTDAVKQKTILASFQGLAMFYEFSNGSWHYKTPHV